MPKYCKAYKYADVKKFPGWSDGLKPGSQLSDEDIVYILENLVVTTNPLDFEASEDHIFSKKTPEWEAFSKDELGFAIPEWQSPGA